MAGCWYSTMQEYDGSQNGIYEYGYSQGSQVNVQLRPGERLTRNWSNRGLHVNQVEGGTPGCLKCPTGQNDLRYSPKYGDLAPGRTRTRQEMAARNGPEGRGLGV